MGGEVPADGALELWVDLLAAMATKACVWMRSCSSATWHSCSTASNSMRLCAAAWRSCSSACLDWLWKMLNKKARSIPVECLLTFEYVPDAPLLLECTDWTEQIELGPSLFFWGESELTFLLLFRRGFGSSALRHTVD